VTAPEGRGEILLLGGNALANRLAESLADDGWTVLVSQATNLASDLAPRDSIAVRRGPLEREGFAELLESRRFKAVVDASHPYAEAVRRLAPTVAEQCGVPYISLLRLETPLSDDPSVHSVISHEGAAALATSFNAPVLATVGANRLTVYVEAAREAGIRLIARVLPESRDRCLAIGMSDNDVFAERGPFSLEDNLRHLRACGAGVIVLKNGGIEGGVPEKLEAARTLGIHAVTVARPRYSGIHLDGVEKVVTALKKMTFGNF
jgi:precorrin-6x reductase